ncbi:MAG: N-acetylglucosamine-6-phosphate deacetylase [Pseudomonadota bacterium]
MRGYIAKRVFDGAVLHKDTALIIDGDRVQGLCNTADIPGACAVTDLGQGILAPGFVDLQVNGGGGRMFNDDPRVETLATIAAAHARLGATTILPTLITDTPEVTAQAIDAVAAAIADGVPGIAGLHLEGPHLSVARKGAHDGALIRAMTEADEEILLEAAQRLPVLKVTVAPESVTVAQIRRLSGAGIVISLGHSDCSYEAALQAFAAGATCVTHLFNAMSQMTARAPGLVGAALDLGFSAGLIADGVHVHPTNVTIALRAKETRGNLFLVSDAMATAGSDIDRFTLNGRAVLRADGRLTLADGTLAGADLDLATAIANMHIDRAEALTMATSRPTQVAGLTDGQGTLVPGGPADFVHLDLDEEPVLRGVWQAGREV